MTAKSFFQCQIGTNNPSMPLGLEIWLDGAKIFDQNHVVETQDFKHSFEDESGDHQLSFVLKNKTIEHTTIDSEGNIVEDAVLFVKDLSFEDIPLGQILFDLSEYRHNFNGNGEETVNKFYGTLGCNGTATLKFSSPIYLWLLENM